MDIQAILSILLIVIIIIGAYFKGRYDEAKVLLKLLDSNPKEPGDGPSTS